MLSPRLEGEGLHNEVKEGLLIAQTMGTLEAAKTAGILLPLPDATMFEVMVGKESKSAELKDLLLQARRDENNDFQDEVAERLFKFCRASGKDKPRIAVLNRSDHQRLIEKLLKLMQISRPINSLVAELNVSNGRLEISGPGGTLVLFERDFWTAGLSLDATHPEAFDLAVGADRSANAQMGAVLMRKLGGSFVGVFIPENLKSFSGEEIQSFAQAGIKDPGHILMLENIVPSIESKDLAVPIGVVREFSLYGQKIPGPVLQNDYSILMNVLWVEDKQVSTAQLRLHTRLAKLLETETRDAHNVSAVLGLALEFVKFGEYDKALNKLETIQEKADSNEKVEIEAVQHYIKGLKLIGKFPGWERGNQGAIQEWEQSLKLIRTHKITHLEKNLQLKAGICQLYMWMREEAVRENDSSEALAKAMAYSHKVLQYSDSGFLNSLRHNELRLKPILAKHQSQIDDYVKQYNRLPDLKTRYALAFDTWMLFHNLREFQNNAEDLIKMGSSLEAAFLFSTVLQQDSLPEQALVFRSLREDAGIRGRLTEIFKKTKKNEFVNSLESFLHEVKDRTDAYPYLNEISHTKPWYHFLTPENMVAEVRRVVERKILCPESQFKFGLASQYFEAKGEVLAGLGQPQVAANYFQEAIHNLFSERSTFSDATPRFAEIMYKIPSIYEELFTLTGETQYKDNAFKNYQVLLNWNAFETELGKYYSKGQVRILWAQIKVLRQRYSDLNLNRDMLHQAFYRYMALGGKSSVSDEPPTAPLFHLGLLFPTALLSLEMMLYFAAPLVWNQWMTALTAATVVTLGFFFYRLPDAWAYLTASPNAIYKPGKFQSDLQQLPQIMDAKLMRLFPEGWHAWLSGTSPNMPQALAEIKTETLEGSPWRLLLTFGKGAAQAGSLLKFRNGFVNRPTARRLAVIAHELTHLAQSLEPSTGRQKLSLWGWLSREIQAVRVEFAVFRQAKRQHLVEVAAAKQSEVATQETVAVEKVDMLKQGVQPAVFPGIKGGELAPGGVKFGTSVSDPARPLLQIFRLPRMLGMALLYAAFWALDRAAVPAVGANRETASGFLAEALRTWFPLNAIETRHFSRQTLQTALLEKGSLWETVYGRFDGRQLDVSDKLTLAAVQTGAAEGLGLRNLRALAARNLIQQIYYYRSAEYYGTNLGSRWQAWFGRGDASRNREELAADLTWELAVKLGEGKNDQEKISLLAAFSEKIQSLRLESARRVVLNYDGFRSDAVEIKNLVLPASAKGADIFKILGQLESLKFSLDDRDKRKLLPINVRPSMAGSS
ncbi:MAG: hypothetical protein HGA76_02905 [Candidatus Firestonebacteria bacterium]|nr:hypothetical protein [Candidatus Firestonebacteria bacterium]